MNIIPAKELAQEHDSSLKIAIEIQMNMIMRANKQGCREVVFDPRPPEQYEAAKAAFVAQGYKFKPIGIIGGVRQIGEYIYW